MHLGETSLHVAVFFRRKVSDGISPHYRRQRRCCNATSALSALSWFRPATAGSREQNASTQKI
jgi:hypothetical protein